MPLDLATISEAELKQLSPTELQVLLWFARWKATARPKQIPPRYDANGVEVDEIGYLAGRGYGKTLVGAQWLGAETYLDPLGLPSHVIAPTLGDVRHTCFEGPVGLLTILPPDIVTDYNKTNLIITIKTQSGKPATIRGFSAEEPERLRGPQCFVAGTAVMTPVGPVAIEDVRAGDWVLTRKGAKRVRFTAQRDAEVGHLTFSNGAKLVGTADHNVYLSSHGWTRMDRLREGDIACAIGASSGVAKRGTSTIANRDTMSAQTSASIRRRVGFIRKCGLLRTALFRMATKFITSTTTSHTTTWATSSFSEKGSTCANICWSEEAFRSGTGTHSQRSMWLATAAAPFFRGSERTEVSSAKPAPIRELTRSSCFPESARNAPPSLSPEKETSAVSVASTWRPMGVRSVYCLTVDGEPEFFANGILVHNCARDWRDEVAAWGKTDQDTWDMANMGLRLGPLPKKLWTTTPKPKELIRALVEPQAGRVIIRGSTYDNRANLPDNFFRQLQQYEGTQLGRQELEGELIDSEEGGIISRSWIRLWPAGMAIPRLEWIILSLDTAFTEKTLDRKTHNADPTAGGCFGVFFQEEIVENKPVMRANVLLLDCWAEHLGFPGLVDKVKREMKVRYGDDQDKAIIRPKFGPAKPRTSGRPPDVLLIEDKGSGISLRQALYREKIESYPYNPGRADKTARLHIVSHIFAAKRFWVPESENKPGKPKSWVEPMLAQLCSFQGEGSIKHDDFVDVCSQALRFFMDKGLLTDMVKPRKGEEDIDAILRRRPRGNPYAA